MKKRRVSSKKALDELALQTGATVKAKDGQQFNAGKVKAKVEPKLEPIPRKEPPPTPTAPPAPAIDSKAINALTEKMSDIGKANVMMLAELKQQISEIQFQAAAPILDWDFEMIRDDKGYLVRIKAHAEIVEPTIN